MALSAPDIEAHDNRFFSFGEMHHCYKIAMLQQLMNGVRQMTHRTELWQSSPSTVGTARGALSRGNPGRSPRRSRRGRQTASNELFNNKTLLLIKRAKGLRSG
jgi:hypothetical protein